jgi:hypothetical protein
VNLLSLLQKHVSPHVRGYSEVKVKDSATPAAVYRLELDYAGGMAEPETLIIKRVQPVFEEDPGFPDREITLYRRILPCLGIPHARVYFTGVDPQTEERLILLEDLVDYRLPPPTRQWTQPEGECIARTYARLHVNARRQLPPPGGRGWLYPRHESRLEREDIPGMVRDLVRLGVWRPVPGLDRLYYSTLEAASSLTRLPSTLLHNDVYPPNVALPKDLDDEAVLLDWEMASFGLPEMDLAFMFIQPFGAHRGLDKARLLDVYWAAREALGDDIPECPEREARQFYADSLWGLWLVPAAHQRAVDPPRPGSDIAAYWDCMFGVVHEQLERLSRSLML